MPAPQDRPSWTYFAGMGCAGLMMVFGAILLLGVAASWRGSSTHAADVLGALLLGVLPVGAGAAWVVHAVRTSRHKQQRAVERQVLALAQQHGGIVTAMEVAAGSDLSLEEAKAYLDRLADHGDIQVTPTDRGLAYAFPGAGGLAPDAPPLPLPGEESREPPRERA